MPDLESSPLHLLNEKKIELLCGRALTPQESAVVAQMKVEDLDRFISLGRPADAILSSSFKLQGFTCDDFLLRALGVWTVLQFCHFLCLRACVPNFFHLGLDGVTSSVCVDAVMLAVLWRYNDQNIQGGSCAYHRLSDVMQMSVGEVFEMLTRRYVFSLFALSSVLGQLSHAWLSINYMVVIDYLLYAVFVTNIIPALYRDLQMILFVDRYSYESSQFIEIPLEMSRSFMGWGLMMGRVKDCIFKHDYDFSNLFVFRPGSVYQFWRFSELGVNALGAVPQGVSEEYIRRSILVVDGVQQFRPSWALWLMGAANTIDGRFVHALINCYHSEYYQDDIYSYRRKVNTLHRGFSLLLEYQHLVPVLFQFLCPRRDFDVNKLVQFSQSLITYIQQDDRLTRRTIIGAELMSQFRPKSTRQENLVVLCLSSDLYLGQPYLYQVRVDQYLSRVVSHTALLMLIIRDLSRFLVVAGESAAPLKELLYWLSHVFRSGASVTWSDRQSSQHAVELMFNQLANYIEHPDNSSRGCYDLRHAVGRIASLSEDDCVSESPVFYWAILDCINFSAHAAGLANVVCGDSFKNFLAGRLLYYMGPSEISLMKKILGENAQRKSQAELVCHFLDTLMTTIEYDLLGCFKRSFEDSIEFNDFLKYGAVKSFELGSDISYMDASTRFLQGIVRFIDNVERRPGLRANIKKNSRKQRAHDHSLIYCLALIFQYFGSGKIFASEMLANMMYRNLLGNPSYVKWWLTIVEVFLSCASLCQGVLCRRARSQWRKNLSRFSYGIYFVVTRSIFHVPRSLLFMGQLSFIAVGSLLYHLGRERFFVFCTCFVGAISIVAHMALPHVFAPVLACLFYYTFQCVLDCIDLLMGSKIHFHAMDCPDGVPVGSVSSSVLRSSQNSPNVVSGVAQAYAMGPLDEEGPTEAFVPPQPFSRAER